MNRLVTLPALGVLLMASLLSACGKAAPDEDEAAAPAGVVAVTTATPVQATFHDTIEAWGSAAGDPQHARTISLAHGGQVTVLHASAGQAVKRGDPLLTITPDPTARSAYRQAQSALTLAAGELKRTEQLAAQRLATQSQLAAARKALADAQATLDAQRALGGGAASETVEAPAAGVVTALRVGLGERIAANAPLLDFTPTHALLALLGVQPDDGSRLHPGMAVQLRAVYGTQTFAGTLRMVGRSINPQSHLLDAQVELPAAAGASLVAGAPLEAQIRTADFTAWSVPRAAVLHDEHGDYLFQVEQGHAKRVDVTLRSAQGDPVGVDGPLDAKAKVIVLGVYELNNGDAVRESAK
ncbi:efflux RND transporter periplasmic adaptor subunit [Rhodanobacter lindaniclasticus]|uniref:Efflux transporter periplasmic adaptor subunit n=1 Tax=Rhodanobacter lindaniclasticus TaxID=75310 RepID=A0A4S3KIB2_9GAMM|nr:efflux RND transporter periplasmic adaptor subunit [Rhodanobacter lindaniclasticus]THD08482.1 efflux transporter periplasmic adaptor subunit [Rhodanobacter lindaniclasticus]